jgi:hypothetical protein
MIASRLLRIPATLTLMSACAAPIHAQEFCGIDSIFTNGYEVGGFTPITQIAGGGSSPGLAQSIVGVGTLSVTLTNPSTSNDAMLDITGTFVGPTNTGISVNGISGYTANGQFLVPGVTLASGSNALSVTATTLPGTTASTSGSITRSASVSPISVSVDRSLGYAPLADTFTYIVGPLAGGASISNVAINFKGTGPNDYSGPLSGAPSTYIYQQPGLYTAQFQFIDSNSVAYTVKRSVVIQDVGGQRGMLCDVYGYLKDRLAVQDATGASSVFQSSEQSTFLAFFSALGSNMPAAASQLGVVVNGVMGVGYADLLLVRDNTDQTRSGFPLRMSQTADGVWRISEM